MEGSSPMPEPSSDGADSMRRSVGGFTGRPAADSCRNPGWLAADYIPGQPSKSGHPPSTRPGLAQAVLRNDELDGPG